eukprot:10419083-Karenia_brevis.AAC.1
MLQPNAYQPAPALVYSFADVGYDLDPNIYVLWKRLHMLRRFLVKCPDCKYIVHDMLHHHQSSGSLGTMHEGLDIGNLSAAPPPGAPNRSKWKATEAPIGPIALLLQQLHYYGLALDATTMCLHHTSCTPFHFVTCPFQLLKSTIYNLAVQARNKQAITQRSVLMHATQVDTIVFKEALRMNKDPTHQKITKYIATLGS